jgi:hypothetical protein
LTIVLPRHASEIVSRAADLITKKTDPRFALAQAFREITAEAARTIGSDLQTLVEALADAYRHASQSLNLKSSDAVDSLRHAATLREVPVPDVPMDLQVPPEGAERWLGRSLAQSVLIKRLEHAAGASVQTTLDSYAAVLRRWALDVLEEIRTQWAAATDSVRAEIDRRLGHAQSRGFEDAEIRQDLGRLTPSTVQP